VDAAAHQIDRLNATSVAQGTRLAWPASPQGRAFAIRDGYLVALDLVNQTRRTIPGQIPWPNSLEWAPNGAWTAYLVSGTAEGKGLYLFAPQDAALRPISLPGGASEKAVLWAGLEYLFVLRQPADATGVDLWLVPLTQDDPPRRIMSNIRLPETGPYSGWRWQDVLATQVVAN
jgi:hypothetical protein